jgi:hypothetical protein
LGPLAFCAASDELIGFADLGKALAAFDSAEEIEQRRTLSVKLEKLFCTHLEKLESAIVDFINRPYQHGPQPWPAIEREGKAPQNPRVLLSKFSSFELIPTGGVVMPIDVSSIQRSDAPLEIYVNAKASLKVGALIKIEVSGIDRNSANPYTSRVSFNLEHPIDTALEVHFNVVFPDGINDESLENFELYINEIACMPVIFDLPSYIDPVGFA